MANLWFVLVLLIAQSVIANCKDYTSCDDCVRNGKQWCNSFPGRDKCTSSMADDACPGAQYEHLEFARVTKGGDLLNPVYAERTIFLQQSHKLNFVYASATKRNITTRFRSHVKSSHVDPKVKIDVLDHKCDGKSCAVNIYATSDPDFCSYHKEVEMKVIVEGLSETATIKYNVPCSCPCSQETEIKSKKCNEHGNYTCGICTCDNEWFGDDCRSGCSRGDISQDSACFDHIAEENEFVECSNNGKCKCGECKCHEDREGSQYFDPSEKCSDICTQTIECHSCLLNGTVGQCECSMDKIINVVSLNETIATTATDVFNGQTRKVWVHCKKSADNCMFDYYAMKDDYNYEVMLISNCNNSTKGYIAGVGGSGTNVPLILGILGLVAVVAAAGGILLWKHMNALPPLPTADPQYANIDAEDCTGENPLYKPPTSSFKNPTYGKW